MYIFNNGRKSLNDQLLTSFCQKSDLVGFLLLSDAHGLLCPQTPAKPYSCVCREKRFKGRTQENVVTWFLWELKLGHQNAKFAREAITAWAKRYMCLTARFWRRTLQ
jgi:hypothetical protein